MRKPPPPQGQDIVEGGMERLKRRTVAKLTSGHDRTAVGLSIQDQPVNILSLSGKRFMNPTKFLIS